MLDKAGVGASWSDAEEVEAVAEARVDDPWGAYDDVVEAGHVPKGGRLVVGPSYWPASPRRPPLGRFRLVAAHSPCCLADDSPPLCFSRHSSLAARSCRALGPRSWG